VAGLLRSEPATVASATKSPARAPSSGEIVRPAG